jgi:SAM-dependent methyltransferase
MTTSRPLPRLDAAEEAGPVRDALSRAGYTADRVAEREGCKDIYGVWVANHRDIPARPVEDALDALIRLFLDCQSVDAGTIHAHLGEKLALRLCALGLLRGAGSQAYRATALLYPTASVFIASDMPTMEDFARIEDAVYPAITPECRSFVRGLPASPCDRFLELCAGTGIAALLAAPCAGHVWATDLTERATHFARFNAMLNGLSNVTAVSGDLYEPVAGATFDRIAAHPPYVAAAERTMIYRDGGSDGEWVTRRVIEGVPQHLAPGGVCYCTCVATDRTGAPLEARLREWMGAAGAQFDVIVVTMTSWRPVDRYPQMVANGKMEAPDAARLLRDFEELKIERQVYASMAIRRHRGNRPGVTLRRQLGTTDDPAPIARLVRWQSELGEPDALPGILECRVRVAPGTTRHVVDQLVDGTWKPMKQSLAREHPFTVRTDADAAVYDFLIRADGVRTVREHWEGMRSAGVISQDLGEEGFATIIRWLAAAGIIDTTLDAPFA